MIEVRDATQEDIELVRQDPVEIAVLKYPKLNISGYAKVAVVDNEVVGIGGVVLLWEGMGEGWIILSRKVLDFRIETLKCIKKMAEQVISELKLRRLQVTIRADFPQAFKMVEAMGFIREGIMEKYLPDGTDALLYARVL